jgi:hypothetical protein
VLATREGQETGVHWDGGLGHGSTAETGENDFCGDERLGMEKPGQNEKFMRENRGVREPQSLKRTPCVRATSVPSANQELVEEPQGYKALQSNF